MAETCLSSHSLPCAEWLDRGVVDQLTIPSFHFLWGTYYGTRLTDTEDIFPCPQQVCHHRGNQGKELISFLFPLTIDRGRWRSKARPSVLHYHLDADDGWHIPLPFCSWASHLMASDPQGFIWLSSKAKWVGTSYLSLLMSEHVSQVIRFTFSYTVVKYTYINIAILANLQCRA